MNIIFSDEFVPNEHVITHMKQAASLCATFEGLDPDRITVSVTFVGSEEIQDLNREYRGVNSITDVLSFPQFDDFEHLPEGELCVGDVVICTEQALVQADEYGHSAERELVYLFVHSMFHLLGYDHLDADEKKDMREAEEHVMVQIGLER